MAPTLYTGVNEEKHKGTHKNNMTLLNGGATGKSKGKNSEALSLRHG
jgi:hypothetical protein